jgi:hypothetical protein
MDIGKTIEVITIEPVFVPKRKTIRTEPDRREVEIPIEQPEREKVLVPARRG